MSKKIEWLDNFAEKFAKNIEKTANKKPASIIVDKQVIKNCKVGDSVKFKGKLYKVADLEYTDEIGPGVILMEVGSEVPTSDPMSMAMGTEVTGLENYCNVEPERARVNPGDIYDLGDVRQEEVDNAEMAAAETNNKIDSENSIDRTTVKNHFSKSDKEEVVVTPIEQPEEVVEETNETSDINEVAEVADEVADEVSDEVEETEAVESNDLEDEEVVVATRTNRILRRIMSSKRNNRK